MARPRHTDATTTDRDLLDWPHTRRPPVALEPLVRGIYDDKARVVTLADLDAYATGMAPQRVAKILRERGWPAPMRTRGAWETNEYRNAA